MQNKILHKIHLFIWLSLLLIISFLIQDTFASTNRQNCRSTFSDALPTDRTFEQLLQAWGPTGFLLRILDSSRNTALRATQRCRSLEMLARFLRENNLVTPFPQGDDRLKCPSIRPQHPRPRGANWFSQSAGLNEIANRIEDENSQLQNCALEILSSFHLNGFDDGIYTMIRKLSTIKALGLSPAKTGQITDLLSQKLLNLDAEGKKEAAKQISCRLCHRVTDNNRSEITLLLKSLHQILATMNRPEDREDREKIIENITKCTFMHSSTRFRLEKMYCRERLTQMIEKPRLTSRDKRELLAKLAYKFVFSPPDQNKSLSRYQLEKMLNILDYSNYNQLQPSDRYILEKFIGEAMGNRDLNSIKQAIRDKFKQAIAQGSPMSPQTLLDIVRLSTEYGGSRAVEPLFEYYKIAVEHHSDRLELRPSPWDPADGHGATSWVNTRQIALDFIIRQKQNTPNELVPILKVVMRHENEDYASSSSPRPLALEVFNSLSGEQKNEIVEELVQNYDQIWLTYQQQITEDRGNDRYYNPPRTAKNVIRLIEGLETNASPRIVSFVSDLVAGNRTGYMSEADDILPIVGSESSEAIPGLLNLLRNPSKIRGAQSRLDIAKMILETDISKADEVLGILVADLDGENSQSVAEMIKELTMRFRPQILQAYNGIRDQLVEKLKQGDINPEAKMSIVNSMIYLKEYPQGREELIKIVDDQSIGSDIKVEIINKINNENLRSDGNNRNISSSERRQRIAQHYDTMMYFLNNPNPDVKVAALNNLRIEMRRSAEEQFLDRAPQILTSLKDLVDDQNNDVKKKAVIALSSLSEALHKDGSEGSDGRYLTQAERDQARSLQREALGKLVTILDDPNYPNYRDESGIYTVSSHLENQIAYIRRVAPEPQYARVLGNINSTRSIAPLMKIYRERSGETRDFALASLVKLMNARSWLKEEIESRARAQGADFASALNSAYARERRRTQPTELVIENPGTSSSPSTGTITQ